MRRIAILTTTALCLAAVGCGGSPQETSDDSIPARDLSLAELARAQDPAAPTVTRVRPRFSAAASILDDVTAGAIEPWEADGHLLNLMLGRVDAVPEQYRPDGAQLSVPDYLPYAVLTRLSGYPRAEAERLRGLLDALTEEMIGGDAGTPRVFGVAGLAAAGALRRSAPVPVAQQSGFIKVVAHPGEEDHGQQALDVAAEAWPRIAAFMQVAIGEITPGATVQFRQPLTTEAQEFIEENGLTPDAQGEVLMYQSTTHQWYVDFGAGTTSAFPVDVDLIQPREAPIEIHLVTGPEQIEAGTPETVEGRFKRCSEIFVVTGSAGECRIAGAVTHELFHCAQALRAGSTNESGLEAARELWAVEGTAMWAMDYFRPEDNYEWSHAAYYAEELTTTSLDDLFHHSGTYFTFVSEHEGGPDKVRDLYDEIVKGTAREQLANILPGLPQAWHRYAASTAGYDGLFDQGTPRLMDAGGEFPYAPTSGCPSFQTVAFGQEHVNDPVTLSPQEAPAFDLALQPLSVWHERVEIADAQELQFIDIALDGDLGAAAATGSPDLEIKAVLVSLDGSETVQDWSQRWASASGPELQVSAPEAQPPLEVDADASFRICLTEDPPCQEADETFPVLEEVRVYVSSASVQTGAELTGQLVMVPGGIRGWTAKAYRDGKPEPEKEGQ